MNPLLALHPSFFEREIFAVDRHFAKNARTLRGVLRSVVESKKEALKKGEVGEEAKFDVVTLLLQDESYTNIEHMIDDALIAVVFGASAVATVTTNLITSLLHEPEVLAKLRAEIGPFMEEVKDNISEKLTLERVAENEYVKLCFQEALRRDTGRAQSSTVCLTKDARIGGIDFRAGDPFVIMIRAM